MITPTGPDQALAIDQMRHPKHHLAEILTGAENGARHLAADLSTATARIHTVLTRPAWGRVAGEDEKAVAEAAADALVAAWSLVRLMGHESEELIAERLWGRYLDPDGAIAECWPFRLSTVLSVVTRRMVASAGPSAVSGLLIWMTGDRPRSATGRLQLGMPASKVAADFCAEGIMTEHKQLAAIELPGIPAMPDTFDTDTVEQPRLIADYVAKIAADLGRFDEPDPWIRITQLPRELRRSYQIEAALAEGT